MSKRLKIHTVSLPEVKNQ